jgi:transposase
MQTQVKKLDFTGQNIYAGIDVHKNNWKVSIYTDELFHKTFTQPPKPDILYNYLTKKFPNGTFYSVYEAGFCGFWIHDQLQALGINSVVVNPADVPTKDKEKKQKDDGVDSNKLARQLRSGDLEGIYIHNRYILEDRNLIRMRYTLSKELTRSKNRIKSLLYFYGIEIPEEYCRNSSYWSKRFFKWLENLKLTRTSGTESLQVLLEHCNEVRQKILRVTREIRKLSQEENYKKKVNLLRSINGIGLITSMVVLTEIDDIHRFSNQDKLASYIGMINTNHSSGEKQIHGEMTNRGNKFLKSTIIESTWTAVRMDPVLILAFTKLSRRMDRNKAIVRIARKLLNRISYVLKNEVLYQDGII